MYPGYGGHPPGYGYPGYGPPHGSSYRGRSRSRSRDRGRDRRSPRRGDRGGTKSGGGRQADSKANSALQETEHQQKMRKMLKSNPGWRSVWIEGIDPPKRAATTPNVTVMLLTRSNVKKDGAEEFGFMLGVSRMAAKKKDREKECAKELVASMEKLPLEQPAAWCQFSSSSAKQDVEPADVERLTAAVRAKVPNATVSVPEPTAFVLVSSAPWGPNEKVDGIDADLAMLEQFDTGYAELLAESRRVNGLVRKQWFISLVLVKQEASDTAQPLALGVGLASDSSLAKARAVHAAEVRSQVLTEAMFPKAATPAPKAEAKAS